MRTPEIAVADTHALIWWLSDQRRRFGRQANAFFERVDAGRAVVCIPAMSLVELGEAVAHGALALPEPFPEFVRRLETTPSRYQVASLTPEIVVHAHNLFRIPERGDRLIAATAAALGYPLVTRDPEIARVIGADHIW
jgi:PIN domain nuclease of toxin-antitoxin system